jgi:hypothetical protein
VKIVERMLLWVPLVSLMVAPLAWGAAESKPAEAAGAKAPSQATPVAGPSNGRVDLSSAAERAAWVARIRDAQKAVDDARIREDDAVLGYGRARHKGKTRGAAKREILEERQESRGAVAEAERNLEQVMTEARSAGVPPGWIREATAGSGPANRD